MTRLGTLNQVDHLHKGSPRHCVIHSQWLLVSLTRQNPSGLAIPTQPNLLSKLHLNRWELVFRVSTWDTSWKLAAGRPPGNLDGPKKNGISHLLNLQKSAFSNVSLVFFGPHGSIAASPSFQALCWDQELQPLLQLSGRPLQLQALSYGGGFVGKFRGKPPNLMFDHYWS
jgi:hypothetical protein